MTDQRLALKVKASVRAAMLDDRNVEVTRGMKGLLVSIMDKMLGDKEARYQVLAWLFDFPDAKMSSKLLTDRQWRGLISWISPAKDPDTSEWMTPANLKSEMNDVFLASLEGSARSYDATKLGRDRRVYTAVEDHRKDKAYENAKPLCVFLEEGDDNLPF